MKTTWLDLGLLAVLAVTIAVHATLGSGDNQAPAIWPEFHGIGRTNQSPETGLLKKWPADGPPRLWQYDKCGIGYSGISIAEGMIFCAGVFDDSEAVFALTLDGKRQWQSPNGPAWQGSCPGSRTTPTYDEGRVYQMSTAGQLSAYDAHSGRTLWSVDLKAAFNAKPGIWGYAENVLVEGEHVLCMPGGENGRVVALDKRTGKVAWVNTAIEHSAAYCSPVIVEHGGRRQMISMTQKSIVGVDVVSGELLWSHAFPPRSPQNATTPEYHDGFVFVAGGHHKGGTLLKIAADSSQASEVWSHEDRDNCHGGVIYQHGNLYGCGCRLGGKSFFCVDFRTGQLKQLDKTLGKVGLTWADGMLYCINHRGRMSLVGLRPDGFDVVSQFELPKKPDNTYLSHPVVCGGRLYLRCEETLYSFNIREQP